MRFRATLGLLLVSVIWGTTFVAVKSALRDAPPLFFVGVRFALAGMTAACLQPLFARSAGAKSRPSSFGRGSLSRTVRVGAPLGAILAGAYATQTLGLISTTPARSAFVTGLNVALVPFWAWILGRQGLGRFPIAGLIITLPGLWLLTTPQAGRWKSGDSWTVACAVLYALYVVLITRIGSGRKAGIAEGKREPVENPPPLGGLLTSQLLVTAVLCLAASAVLERDGLRLTWRLAAALAVTAWPATVLTTWLQLKLQPRVGSTRSAVIFATEPIFAALFSWALTGEKLSIAACAGGGLILAGMLISEIGSQFAAAERS